MSSVPKAKHSTITDLHIEPADWASYPSVDRSTLTGCVYRNLGAGTKIERSTLTGVVIAGEPAPGPPTGDASSIRRSSVRDSEIHASALERSDVRDSRASHAGVARSILDRCKLAGGPAGARVRCERSSLASSEVAGRSSVSRTVVRESVLEGVRAERSTVRKSFVTGSRLERATVVGCDVEGCEIRATSFKGKFVRNGKWDRGNLVGRVDGSREVVVRDMDAADAAGPGLGARSDGGAVRDVGAVSDTVGSGMQDGAPPAYTPSAAGSADTSRGMYAGENQGAMPEKDPGVFEEEEDEKAMLAALEAYDGPRVNTPPPYDE